MDSCNTKELPEYRPGIYILNTIVISFSILSIFYSLYFRGDIFSSLLAGILLFYSAYNTVRFGSIWENGRRAGVRRLRREKHQAAETPKK